MLGEGANFLSHAQLSTKTCTRAPGGTSAYLPATPHLKTATSSTVVLVCILSAVVNDTSAHFDPDAMTARPFLESGGAH